MKIGIYCTNTQVYPLPAGTIYANMAVAGDLANELTRQGHDVTFFAPIGTKSNAKVVDFGMLPFSDERIYKKYPHHGSSYEYESLMMIQALNYMEENDFDIFHSHTRPFSTLNQSPLKKNLPTLLTIHDPLTGRAYNIFPQYNQFPNIYLSSLSFAQRKDQPNANWFSNVYNGIDIDAWEFGKEPGKYLLFVGRVMPEKGPDIAVQIAVKTRLPLKIAGSIYDTDREFFDTEIKPYLNNEIEYLGSLSKSDLRDLYKNALALLIPVRWAEPFGLVMIEAMASGTPIIGSAQGSLPEVIVNGETGFINPEGLVEGYVEAVQKLSNISRQDCRDHVEANFTTEVMAKNYLDVYKKILG